MNLENVNKAIAVMERAKATGALLDMLEWRNDNYKLNTEEELRECGTAACFAGWVAVSPEFAADGGSFGSSGFPTMNQKIGEMAIAEWLDIDTDEASSLCYLYDGARAYPECEVDEDERHPDIDEVLAALYRLRDTGTVMCGGKS